MIGTSNQSVPESWPLIWEVEELENQLGGLRNGCFFTGTILFSVKFRVKFTVVNVGVRCWKELAIIPSGYFTYADCKLWPMEAD